MKKRAGGTLCSSYGEASPSQMLGKFYFLSPEHKKTKFNGFKNIDKNYLPLFPCCKII